MLILRNYDAIDWLKYNKESNIMTALQKWVLQCNMPQVARQASLMSFLILLRLPSPLRSESSERALATGCSILGDV